LQKAQPCLGDACVFHKQSDFSGFLGIKARGVKLGHRRKVAQFGRVGNGLQACPPRRFYCRANTSGVVADDRFIAELPLV